MSHCSVVVLFPGSPTLDHIDGAMQPFRYDAGHDDLGWDGYTIREWGSVRHLIEQDYQWFGQVIGGRFERYNRDAVKLFADHVYVWLDVHE